MKNKEDFKRVVLSLFEQIKHNVDSLESLYIMLLDNYVEKEVKQNG